jgi:aminoglycoside phosphotransferase (APT) family kinase protein
MTDPQDLLIQTDLENRCRRLLEYLGLAEAGVSMSVQPLSGGVASDIARIDLGAGMYCAKFALAKLRVKADWFAPVHRNAAEFEWLNRAARVVPGNVPCLFGRSVRENGFVMEYLDGSDIFLWKAALLAGQPPAGEAAAVADVLGRIHAASAQPEFDTSPFQNRDDFRALRLEPYLGFTATRHPDLAANLAALEQALYGARTVLVHGDVSPKNILLRSGAPIFLDAECATMGDAAFDLAFCLNHLVLKAVHLSPACRMGRSRCTGGAGGGTAACADAGAGRWQVAGGISG